MLHDRDLVSIQEVRSKVEKTYAAWTKYRSFSQEKIDAVVEAMAEAGRANAQRLAEMAVEETGYGNARDKLIKNLLCSDLLPRTMRGMKTVGVLRELPEQKVVEIGVPMGVVAAILPTTNPTSTTIYKILISLKAGNAIIVSPHPRARACSCETADLLYQAARQAGAPEDIIGCITSATVEATSELMRHKRTGVILSTGGSGIVRAAYSSGKPSFGVGPGNVPVLVDASADIAEAVSSVVAGKSFDYGTVCSSEQTIVAERSLRDRILAELKSVNAHFCDAAQSQALAHLLVTPNFTINPDCVGQAPEKIAKMAGFSVPSGTSVLVTEIFGVGKNHPLSAEKLSPVLSLLFVENHAAAIDACEAILRFGGLGHTAVIYAKDEARVREFGLRMPAFRVLVNTPAPQGSTGITTNLFPAMTLGCGAVAGNVTGDNVSPLHLINIKRIAYEVRKSEEAFSIPKPSAPIAVSSVPSAVPDRQMLVAAVEKYLAQRGFPQAPAGVNTTPVADVVDRFLATRRSKPHTAAVAASIEVPSVPPPAAPPPQPPMTVVDFVCEDDVRKAIRESRKIFIGPRTIVTPSARDLATQHDTLVLAKR